MLLAASAAIAWMTHSEQQAERLLAEQGVPAEGEIVRRFLAPNGVTPRLEYRVRTPAGDAPVRNAEVTRSYWDSLAGQTTVPIRAVPGQPSISRLAEGEAPAEQDFFKTPLGGFGLAAAGGLMSLFIFSLGILQLCGWDLDLDSKSGKLAVKRFGAGQ